MASKVYYGSPRQARLNAKETLPAKLDLILEQLNVRERVKDETAALDMIAKTPLIEENLPSIFEVHTREVHPFRWQHGPYKDPYLVTVYGDR